MLKVLDHTGDTEIKWNPDNLDEVNAARETWNKLVGQKRYLAYRVHGTGRDARREQIREFDPDAEKVVLTPQLVGG